MTELFDEKRMRALAVSVGQESANRSAYALSGAPEPDAASEALTLGGELGVPPVAVTGAPDVFRSQASQKRATTALTGAPKTSAWLADPINAGLAKDDLDNLTAWEKFALSGGFFEKSRSDEFENAAVGRAFERGVRTIVAAPATVGAGLDAQTLADAGRTAQDIYREELAKLGPNALPQHRATALQTAQARFEAAQGLSEDDVRDVLTRGARDFLFSEQQKEKVQGLKLSDAAQDFADRNLANAEPGLIGALVPFFDNPVGGAAFIAETAAEFLPIMLVAAGVTGVTKSPVAGALTQFTGSLTVENTSEVWDFLESKGTKVESIEDAMAVLQDSELMAEARQRGLTRGVIIGLFDAVSGGVAGKALSKSPVADAMLQGVVQMAMGGGGEATAQLALGDEFSWTDVVVEALAELATLPVEVLGVGGRAFLRDTAKVAKAGDAAVALSQVDAIAAESQVKLRSPEKFQEALEAQGLGEKSVYVPADGLREYFQAKDVPFEEALTALGIDTETFSELADSGADVAIPLANYAARISGTEDAAWLAENAVFEPGEMSAAQVEAFNVTASEVMMRAYQEAEAQWQADRESRADDVQIQDNIRAQLREAGVSPDAADNQSRVWGAFFRTMSERYGEPALDLARRFGVRVVGPQSEETRRRGALDISLNTLRKSGVKTEGRTLSQFVKDEGGIQDRGGDVAAMDAPSGIIAESYGDILARESQPGLPGAMPSVGKGAKIEDMARKAAEAGYFPELLGEMTGGTQGESSDLVARFVEALREDIAGRPVYVVGEGPDVELQRLQEELDRRGIDLALSNDEIAAALEEQGGATFEQAPAVESDAFKAWFGDSKVVDESGAPLVVYHGAPDVRGILDGGFKPSPMRGDVFFFTDSSTVANTYADDSRALDYQNAEPHVIPLYLSLQNPLVIDAKGQKWRETEKHIKQARDGGHDGIIIKNSRDEYNNTGNGGAESTVYAAFSPTQMKSAMTASLRSRIDGIDIGGGANRGTFDPQDPRILYQADAQFAAYQEAKAEADRLLDEVKNGGDAKEAFDAFARTGERRDELAQAIAKEDGGIELSNGRGDLFAAVTKSQAVDGGWRVTFFNDTGFLGHTEQPTKLAAVQQALDEGYTTEAEGALRKAMKARTFFQNAYGSIQFPPRGIEGGETVINLFQTDNLSTFLHESGHYMLEAFTALAGEKHAPAGMQEDLARIRSYLGNNGEALTTEQHETFARSFEAYLLEGKAPSYDLAPAFARFKAWLMRIYQSVRGLNVPINDEIRGVFDRMLATEAEIQAVRDDMALHPLFREAPANMAPTDWSTYQRMARRAQERADERLLNKTMAKVRREREAWYRAEKKAVLAEVTDEFNKLREYRLIDMIANGVWIGSDRNVPDMRIDRAALVEMFGDGVLSELSRPHLGGKRAIYANDGAHPSEVAEFFGFASASEMVEVLQNTRKKKDAIKAEVERRMDERHGDPLNDGSIEEEALAAIHNEAQAELATTEARHIARQLGRDASMVRSKIYRQRARMMIGRMAVGQASKPATFLAAERKAAKEAESAMAKVARGGGTEALARAFQAKEQQILNGFLFNESRKVEASLGKIRERMRNYDKPKVREKLAGGYIEQIDAILEDYDFRVRTRKDVERSESLNAFVERMISEGREGELAIDPRLMEEARRKHYTKIQVDELNGIVDTIANIDHMGRFKQKLIDAQKKRDFDKTVDEVVDAIGANLKPATRTRKSNARRAAESLRAALNTLLTADSIIADLDGSDEFGDVYRSIKADIDRGQSRETKMQRELAESLDALFSVYSASEISAMGKLRHIDGAPREMTKWEAIAAALNTGNDDNMQRLLANDVPKADKIDAPMLDAILSTLDKRDWDFVQSVWDLIDSYAKEAFDVEERRTGVRPKKVEARPVKTKFGIYRGGYYPIKYDGDATSNARMDEKSAWDKFQSAGRAGKAQTKNGHLQARKTTGNGRVLNLDMSVAFGHLRDVVHGIALSEAVDNAHRILNDPRVGAAFIEKGRVQDQDSLNLWLKDLAQGPMRSGDWVNKVLRTVKNNFTLSRLAFNFKTVALQVTGLGQSAATIGKRNMAIGIARYMSDMPGTVRLVLDASPFMQERETTFQKDIYDFANDIDATTPMRSRYKKGKQVLGKAGFYLITKTQFYGVDMPTWLGAYADAARRGLSDADAVLFADGMVRKAQGSGIMPDMPGVSRGTVSERTRQSDFLRLLTTLGGYMLTKLNRAHMRAARTRRDIRASNGALQTAGIALDATVDFALLYLFEGALMALGYSMMTDDDEPEEYLPFIGQEAIAALFGGIPLVREAASPYGGGGIYGTMIDAPLNMVEQIMQGEPDKAARRAVFNMVGIGTGLPTTAAERAINGLIDDETSPAEALFGRNPFED